MVDFCLVGPAASAADAHERPALAQPSHHRRDRQKVSAAPGSAPLPVSTAFPPDPEAARRARRPEARRPQAQGVPEVTD